jgi:hypothetical protein
MPVSHTLFNHPGGHTSLGQVIVRYPIIYTLLNKRVLSLEPYIVCQLEV